MKRRLFACPSCNGEGGHTEPVLDYGIGPYEPCPFCDEKGTISLWKRLLWWWTVQMPLRSKK